MRNEAILLLGPTGAGKTPLGNCLAERGVFERRCVHFDFGERLRHVAEHGGRALSPGDIATVRNVLTGGALLEDDTFHIARTILNVFMEEQDAGKEDLIILNGLPRHAGPSNARRRSPMTALQRTAAATARNARMIRSLRLHASWRSTPHVRAPCLSIINQRASFVISFRLASIRHLIKYGKR